ncbi:MAG: DUF6356 family protein, partial [Sphingomonadales bacterium]
NYLTEHQRSVGETYFQHFYHASGFAFKMLFGGIACLIHAFFPFLFTQTSSKLIDELHEKLISNRKNLTKK